MHDGITVIQRQVNVLQCRLLHLDHLYEFVSLTFDIIEIYIVLITADFVDYIAVAHDIIVYVILAALHMGIDGHLGSSDGASDKKVWRP